MKSHLLLLLILCVSFCCAQDHGWPMAARVSIPDLPVVTQTGDHLRFNSEVIKDRIAIVTGFFTTCASMCPTTQENLSHVATLLGPRLGKDVIIVSLSVDPENDTPERMRAWGEKFHIGQGWVLAGGNKTDVQTLLKSLGLFVDLPQRHQSALMVGSESSGWVRISSWASPEKLVKLVDGMASTGNGSRGGSTSSSR